MNDLKSLVKSTPYLNRVAKWANARVKGTWKSDPSYWMSKIVTSKATQVVQIGSNDGKTGDPLFQLFKRRPKWKGLFVEPVPYLFERLQRNYSDSNRFAFENAAVNDGKIVSFFWVDESAKQTLKDLPEWYDQLGSFNKDHITGHIPMLEPFIRQAEITGVTLSDLFAKHHIEEIGIFHIDTEGHDFKILSQLDLKMIRPEVILFEHNHLSDEEKRASISFLDSGYQLYKLGGDMLAVSKKANKATQSTLYPLRDSRVNDV